MNKTIHTSKAPAAIGPYSQAIKVNTSGKTVYVSGQIPLDPNSMQIISDDFTDQARQAFTNLNEVIKAAGGSFADVVKLNVYLTDLANFSVLNELMSELFNQPFPARAAVQVSALPKKVQVEIDAILHIE